MIKEFIIHSGNDYYYVKDFVEPFLEGKVDIEGNETANPKLSKVSLLSLESKERIWKNKALRKIK